jgi:hypothetical protein
MLTSVVDPDPVRGRGPDPGSFYYEAKIVRKTLIPTVLYLQKVISRKK